MEEILKALSDLGTTVETRVGAVEAGLAEVRASRPAIYQGEIDKVAKEAFWEAVFTRAATLQPGDIKPQADEIRKTKSFAKIEKAGLSTADTNYFAATTSSQLVADVVEGNWLNVLPRVPVRGSSIKVPVQSSATGVVLLSENTGDTAQIVAAGTAGTRSVTLDPPTLAVRIPVTKQAMQDSYLDLMGVLVEQAVRSLRDAVQFVCINGDTAGTFDGDSYASNDKRKAFDGWRKLAYTSGKVDASTFGIDKIFDVKTLMGAYGGVDLLAIASWDAYQAAAEKVAGLYNFADFTLETGKLPRHLGATWIGTNLVPQTHTDGLVNATPGNNVKGSIVLVDPKSFILGFAQDIEVELEYSAVGQVYNIVVSARVAMGQSGAGQACGLAYGI